MNDNEKQSTRLPRQLAAFSHRNYRLYFAGMAISFAGTWLQNIAQGWLVLQITDSPLLLGVVSSVASLPVLLFSLWAGVVADRVNKRRLLIGTQTAALVLTFILAVLTLLGVVNIYHILVVGFLLGTVVAFDWPTRQALVIKLVGRKDLLNAISMNSAAFNAARIVGPAIAGAVIAGIGTAGAFFLNSASFAAVIVALLLMRIEDTPVSDGATALESLREGLQFVRAHRMMAGLMVSAGAVSIFATPYAVLMPVFARDILKIGPAGLGYLMSAVGVGAILGVLTLSSLGDFERKGRLLLAGNMTFCGALVLFSFSRTVFLSLPLLAVAGWGLMVSMALMNTLIQMASPDFLRARVLSVYTIMIMGLSPLGSLQAGIVADWLGAPAAVSLAAVLCAGIVVAMSPRFVREVI
ncbi:MAG: MFS transporter [Armatimonadota bacterium]